MSLFVWNDKSWMFVENPLEYDMRNFVIVRKLFIKWKKSNDKPFSTDEIKRGLRLFGPIESIQILNELKTSLEVYVLYEKCQSAFEAFYANRSGILSTPNLLQIVPADTWHQPDSHSIWNTIDPEKCSILNLNDDCLLHICTFLDFDTLIKMAYVCTRFKNLLDEFYFPKRKIHSILVFHASLNSIRLAMKCIGPHLEHLTLRYSNHCVKTKNYLQSEHEERATYKILQYCGENLKKLSIHKPEGRKPLDKLCDLLMPALRKIVCLEWNTDFDCSTIEKLHELSPHLETLILKKRTFSCECKHITSHLHWPTLKSLSTFQHMFALNTPCQQYFERFIYLNPQLKRLKLTNVNGELFNVITEHCENLEYLEMLQNSDQCNIHSETTIHLLKK
ncbi:uncharacterized protein LOC116338069 [Contarinia nasturtii]|uniref:uncharacterized protein LOC116338069 n=1 Tax=Contarinia nasturtii TaxID=265458 RepID=UPI0012D43E88|nr:uncharacterized protein LOC116338069 [Contarinia nasturtii]